MENESRFQGKMDLLHNPLSSISNNHNQILAKQERILAAEKEALTPKINHRSRSISSNSVKKEALRTALECLSGKPDSREHPSKTLHCKCGDETSPTADRP